MMSQCRFTDCTKCTSLLGDVGDGRGYAFTCVFVGACIWKISAPSSQFCCEPEIAFRKQLMFKAFTKYPLCTKHYVRHWERWRTNTNSCTLSSCEASLRRKKIFYNLLTDPSTLGPLGEKRNGGSLSAGTYSPKKSLTPGARMCWVRQLISPDVPEYCKDTWPN